MMKDLLAATTNRGKIKEIKNIFTDLPVNIITLDNYPHLKKVDEDGDSFKDNALKKAHIRAEKSGLITIADDSGLEVDYLKGRPGIYSSRFAGPDAGDEENNRKLMQELKDVPHQKRGARFKCIIAVVDPVNKKEITVEGVCKGRILTEPRGKNGFGYDPLFYLPDLNKTMAELALTEKNKISHRARALAKVKDIILKDFL